MAPIGLPQPVTELCGFKVNALFQCDSNGPDSQTINLDRPRRGLWHLSEERKPPISIGIRIRMRECVREVAPNVSVIREPNQGSLITSRPFADYALFALKSHSCTVPSGRLTFDMSGSQRATDLYGASKRP